jgi:cell division protein ZapA
MYACSSRRGPARAVTGALGVERRKLREGAMSQVTITVDGRNYKLSCRDGEESRVTQLASFVEAHLLEIKSGARQVPNERLLLMAALMIADELMEMREELEQALAHMAQLRGYSLVDAGAGYVPSREVARVIDLASARLHALSARLSRAGWGGE